MPFNDVLPFLMTPKADPNSIGESLEEYAARTGRSVSQAYRQWHAHGVSVGIDWSEPCTATRHDGIDAPHVVIAGRNSLGLTPRDVKALASGVY